jgi:putative ABC transport system permease protein
MRKLSALGLTWRLCFALSAIPLLLWPVFAFLRPDADLSFMCRFGVGLFLPPACVLGIVDYGWYRFIHDLPESLRIAATQIRANKMRSALTALGVIIGIVAVTLMGTAILGIDAGVERSFSGFGDDILYVSKWPWGAVDDWWVYRNRPEISVSYAAPINEWIADHPDSTLKVAVPTAEWNATIIHGDLRISNIYTVGTTADLGRIVRSDMKEGRFFTDVEARAGRNVAVIGFDVADALFPGQSPIGQQIQIRSQRYTVVGVAARQGSFLGLFSWDSQVIMPLDAFARSFPLRWAQPELRVQVDETRIADAKDELRGVMRRIRRLSPEKKDDFNINSQQVMRDQLEPIKRGIFVGGMLIVSLALLVGAIGIMNITYVSVKERTKEIGTRKALGARRNTILMQFLIEAVSIATLGGALGLATAGGLAGAAGVLFPQFPIVFSPIVVFAGLGISVLVGVFSGFAPAWTASKLDPVVALRYE